MSHPPPYTFRMKNKNKVGLGSKPNTSVVSLTPPFHPETFRGSDLALSLTPRFSEVAPPSNKEVNCFSSFPGQGAAQSRFACIPWVPGFRGYLFAINLFAYAFPLCVF